MKAARGFTLVEVLVVIAISAILLTIATLNWNQMTTKAAVESQARTMHADMMEVRMQALYTKKQRRVDTTVVGSATFFNIYSTTAVSSPPLLSKKLKYPIVWSSGSAVRFDSRGLTNDEATICILPTNDTLVVNAATVDSIVISTARINLGRRNGGNCTSANIDQK